jgi:hypothetical protein
MKFLKKKINFLAAVKTKEKRRGLKIVKNYSYKNRKISYKNVKKSKKTEKVLRYFTVF